MEETDEQVVLLRRYQRSLENRDIKEGVYIKEEKVEFEYREFFGPKVGMWVPKKFVEMPIEIARIKYPYEQRPKFILTNLDLDVNLSINLFGQPITDEQIPQAINGYKMLLKRSQPSILFFQEAVEDLDGKKRGWFDYKTYSLDEQIYNLMFLTGIGGKLFLGAFNCIFKDYLEWKYNAIQMIRTITDIEEERKRKGKKRVAAL